MMLTATNYDQGWTPAGVGYSVTLRHGMPAPVAGRDNKFQPLALPSLKAGGRSRRVGCAQRRRQIGAGEGAVTASYICSTIRNTRHLFAPRTIILDEIHDLRICELSGRHATLARGAVGQSIPDQLGCQGAVGPVQHVDVPFTVHGFDAVEPKRGHLEPCSPNRGIPLL